MKYDLDRTRPGPPDKGVSRPCLMFTGSLNSLKDNSNSGDRENGGDLE